MTTYTKQALIDYLGGNTVLAAKKLGYDGHRGENNIYSLPDVLTTRQCKVIVMRMKAARIKVPKELNLASLLK